MNVNDHQLVKYQLLSRCYIDDRFYKGGEIVEKPEGWQGPRRSRQGQSEVPLFRRADEEA
jgi:hypothetical protein